MNGTIYLWVLDAVLSGALVGLLGFVVKGVFSLQSWFMEPIIIGAIAGVVAVLITVAPSETGEQISPVRILPRTTPGISTANPVASHSDPLIGEGTKAFARLGCERLRIFTWLVFQIPGAPVLFVL